MRRLLGLVFLVACTPTPKPVAPATPPVAPAPAPPPAPPPAPAVEVVAADTPRTTVAGNMFTVPAGWSIEVRAPATIVSPPEPGNHVVLFDVAAKDADAAVAAAWKAYRPDPPWPLLVTNDLPDRDAWEHRRMYRYETSPNEKRDVFATAEQANDIWTVMIVDMEVAVEEKRESQLLLLANHLAPKGAVRESFAGKPAAKLDAARIAALEKFITDGMRETGVPGVALGLVQDGKIVYAGGLGVRGPGSTQKVDADTLFLIASNTKSLTTLLLAKLVASGKLAWDTKVTSLLPSFALGDPEVTQQVEVKHLVCACTGMPRQDLEWLLEFAHENAETSMARLAKMQPTSKFGEMFQYSNLMAAAAGFVAGHVLYPKLELGAAYDRAIREQVLDPLGMKATTFDYARALRGNHAMPEAPDLDGKPARALMEINYSAIPVRPAGAAWSNVRDLLRYVQMELAEGKLPDGKTYIAAAPLLERRAAQVHVSEDETYGMGLEVDHSYGIEVVHHGGALVGYHSDIIWLPEQQVGAVILTNGELGRALRTQFRRKLLEVLFDGEPDADAELAAQTKAYFDELAAERKRLTVPADPAETGKLAAHYHNDALGDLAVVHAGGQTIFDLGEFRSAVASRRNPDGSISYVLTAPGVIGFEVVVGSTKDGKRTLIGRDAQHEYVFVEQ